VLCFEPTEHFGEILKKNLEHNNISNVELIALGLSSKEQDLVIQIGVSSASLHSEKDVTRNSESIKLISLDGFLEKYPLERIDFVKIDVDGHEPLILEGAWKTLDKYAPIILLEVSHQHYLKAGYTAWDFYHSLKQRHYNIYHESGLKELCTEQEFLLKCGNFTHSANIVITKRELLP
jgi:FkbM family methyltransferase